METVIKNRRQTGILVTHVRFEHDVYIGRRVTRGGHRQPASKWANPIPLPKNATPEDRENNLALYRLYILGTAHLRAAIEAGELRGKRIACWCKKKGHDDKTLCHGDVLVDLTAELCPVIDQGKVTE